MPSADVELVKAVTGWDWKLHEINAKREAVTITQINKSFSKRSLGLLETDNLTLQVNAEKLRNESLEFIRKTASKHDRVLLVTYKKLEELWEGQLPHNVDIEHFGNIRGKDQYKNHPCLILLGQNKPNPEHVRIQARAAFGDAVLTEPLCTDRLTHQIQDCETEQAIDRLRLIGNTKHRHVHLLMASVPPGITPDKVLNWTESKSNCTAEDTFNAIVERFGGFPMSATFIHRHASDLPGLSTVESVRNLFKRKFKSLVIELKMGQHSVIVSTRCRPNLKRGYWKTLIEQ